MRFAVLAAILSASAAACSAADPLPAYDVTVTFNEQYTDAGGAEVEALLLSFDSKADIRVQESFPPVARTTIRTAREDVCEELLRRLVERPDIGNLNCQPLRPGSPTP